ncbi:MAG: FHA domain-containing protein [Candidatus Latescibacterota bacterium]
MVICAHCGHRNRNSASFCTFCGNRLPDERYLVGRLIILDEAHPREYLLAGVERCIGRDPGNDVVVDDLEMSGRHARITFRDEAFWLEDLGSTNGTYANGRRLGAVTRLQDDDLLKMGRTLFKFRV